MRASPPSPNTSCAGVITVEATDSKVNRIMSQLMLRPLDFI